MAGYRAGFVAGDPAVVAELLAVRKHAGMMVPTPVQAAMVAALDDDAHEREQRERYARRRAAAAACAAVGGADRRPFRGRALSLGDPRRAVPRHRCVAGAATASWLRPASSTGRADRSHVRVALTATDERIAAAVQRLTALNWPTQSVPNGPPADGYPATSVEGMPIGPSPTNTFDVLLHRNPAIAPDSGAMVATVTIPPGDPGSRSAPPFRPGVRLRARGRDPLRTRRRRAVSDQGRRGVLGAGF